MRIPEVGSGEPEIQHAIDLLRRHFNDKADILMLGWRINGETKLGFVSGDWVSDAHAAAFIREVFEKIKESLDG